MKKNYNKPDLVIESLGIQTVDIKTCEDAADYWYQIPMGQDDEGNDIIVFVPEIQCTMTDCEYMESQTDDDKACLYASTNDGQTFNS